MVVGSGSAGTQSHWGPDPGASAVFQFVLLIPELAELVAPLGHTMGIVIKFDHQSLYTHGAFLGPPPFVAQGIMTIRPSAANVRTICR